jgi:hypothetical protein
MVGIADNRRSLEKIVEFIGLARRIETVTTPLKVNCITMLQILYTPQHDPVEDCFPVLDLTAKSQTGHHFAFSFQCAVL